MVLNTSQIHLQTVDIISKTLSGEHTFIFGFWEDVGISETDVYFTLEILAELIFLPTETDVKPILSLLQKEPPKISLHVRMSLHLPLHSG